MDNGRNLSGYWSGRKQGDGLGYIRARAGSRCTRASAVPIPKVCTSCQTNIHIVTVVSLGIGRQELLRQAKAMELLLHTTDT